MDKKEINRQRELSNYEDTHLYNVAKYGVKDNLPPIERPIKEVKAGTDNAEYGVIFINSKGIKVTQRFSTLEKAHDAAEQHGGRVVRLGGKPRSPFDKYKYGSDATTEPSIKARIDESGTVEFMEQPLEGDKDYNAIISLALTEMGAIQYKGTRPSAEQLLELHRRHPDMSFVDFAAAVAKHCDIPVKKERKEYKTIIPRRTYEEKEAWYSTPAGQQWLKKYSVPAIMAHTKEDYFVWKSQEQSR